MSDSPKTILLNLRASDSTVEQATVLEACDCMAASTVGRRYDFMHAVWLSLAKSSVSPLPTTSSNPGNVASCSE